MGAEQSPAQDDSNQASIAIEALSRLKGIDLEANPPLKAAVLKVLEQTRGSPQFVEIVRDFKITGQGKGVLEAAMKNLNAPVAVDAMRLLLQDEDVDLLRGTLSGTNCVPIIHAIGDTRDGLMVPLLLPVVTNAVRDFPIRKEAVRALAKIETGAAALLATAMDKSLPDDLKLVAASELNAVRWTTIKTQAAEILPLPSARGAEPLPPVFELVKMAGDASKGAEVFRRDSVGCLKCHQVNGEGTDFGPNLSEIGGKLAKEALYESILDPSAGIAFGYEAWQLDLANGEEAYGLLVSETPDDVAIKSIGGIVTRYKKSEIRQRRKQTVSIMPTGLQQTMSRQDLMDLVEYLASLKTRKN
jgi:putative heme-binding domain-containing protein